LLLRERAPGDGVWPAHRTLAGNARERAREHATRGVGDASAGLFANPVTLKVNAGSLVPKSLLCGSAATFSGAGVMARSLPV